MKPLSALALCLGLLALPAFGQTSGYGCKFTDTASALPSVEGKDGVFYRVLADLRMRHPMEDAVTARMGALSAALQAGGTTLIYLSVPTKSQAMPQTLPDAAADYQFDVATAKLVYQDIVTRLGQNGVLAPDMLAALQTIRPDQLPFFQTDFHWTAEGARATAEAIGTMIKAQPGYQGLTPSEFRTTELEPTAAFSTMRRTLQAFCIDELPRVEARAHLTEKTAGSADAAADIFAGDDQAVQIVLVGTSFSDSPLGNFAGYLSEYSGLDVVNYAVTGGNQFGAITSYLTSRDFADNRPRFLIWENPIYNNLAQFGPDAMEELITAASDRCSVVLPGKITAEDTMTADLTGLTLHRGDSILADLGSDGARAVTYRFTTASGITRSAQMRRTDRMMASGRFFKSLGTIWHPDLQSLSVQFDQPVNANTTLTLCPAQKDPA